MNTGWLKKLLPHFIAIAIFLIVAAVFCKPALQGKVLQQSDIAGWQGMAQNAFDYQAKHGHAPLWITSMFGGMPNYTIAMGGPWTPVGFFNNMMQLWLPKPMNFFFLACICFYLFMIVLRIRPWLAIMASLAFAYSSFSVIIVNAGHDTQMLALAYCPAVLAGITLIYQRRYLTGVAVTAFFTMLNIGVNHQQISYYLLLIAVFMTVAYMIQWVKKGEMVHMGKALAFTLGAGAIGVLVSALNLFTTYDYAKYSKRGGQLIMNTAAAESKDKTDAQGKTKGLTKEYAFQWSYGKAETFTLMFPGVQGYGARGAVLGETSHVAQYLSDKAGQPLEQAAQIAQSLSGALYWGDQPFTDGPVYLGAVICFLFLFGMVFSKSEHKWWILAASVFAILLSWGKHLPGLNYFLFDYLPLYNKFRVPTMTLVIPQILFPVLAAIGLNELIDRKLQTQENWKSLRLSVLLTAIVFVMAGWMYIGSDFKNENAQRTEAFNAIMNAKAPDAQNQMAALNDKYEPMPDNRLYENLVYQTQGNTEIARGIVNALHKDRQSVFGKDLTRAFVFVLLAVVLLGFFIRNKWNDNILLAGVVLLSFIDLMMVAKNYLTEESYVESDQYETVTFPKSAADEMILKDKEINFRVFNTTGGDPFQESRTSYYHNSIGGYNPAKIGIYDDLITYQLSGNTNAQVVNMLNTKYIIQRDPQTNNPIAYQNPDRLGNAWFVKSVAFVKGPAAEMTALNKFNPRDTAIVDESFKAQITDAIQFDSTASISITQFDNDAITYESNATTPQIAIFSEIYYPGGWNVYVDGNKASYFKANYVLRGMKVPAGKHKIEFKFEPESYRIGGLLSTLFSYILLALLALALFFTFKPFLKKTTV